MNIESINFLLTKYYAYLSSTQYLYQNELKEPSTYPEGKVQPLIKYKVEIEYLEMLIKELEELKDSLERFLM